MRQTLQKVINFSDITIDIVGCFIWLDGNTYPYKDQLKEYGFKWSGQRKNGIGRMANTASVAIVN